MTSFPPNAPENADGNRGQQNQRVSAPNASPKARVLVEIDGKIVKECALDQPLLTVGRLSDNDLHVPSQRVSRVHATIREKNGSWIIDDLESLNGLNYRGKRVPRLTMHDGDRIYIAPAVSLKFLTS